MNPYRILADFVAELSERVARVNHVHFETVLLHEEVYQLLGVAAGLELLADLLLAEDVLQGLHPLLKPLELRHNFRTLLSQLLGGI